MAIIPPRRNEFLTRDGVPTQRFAEYLEQLSAQTNSNAEVAETNSIETAIALVFNLENRIGSGDLLTSDDTGFTVDTDTLTVDMDEA